MTINDPPTWQSPPPWEPTPAQIEQSKQRELISGVIIGALLIVARLVAPMLPLFHGHSLNEANSYCTGAVGLLVKGFGGAQAVAGCNRVSHWMLALNLAAVTGAVLVILCGVFLAVRAQRPAGN